MINLNTYEFCDGCPFFEAETEKLYADGLVFSTEILCRHSNICNSLYSRLKNHAKEEKCAFKDGVVIKPDGVNELDPCVYEVVETHQNVTVNVLKCKKCGHIELEWSKDEEML